MLDNIYIGGFCFLAIISILFAIASIFTKKNLRAAICLCMFMLCIAGFYLMLNAEFMAAVQILIYIGGIIVLLIFIIMITQTGNNNTITCPLIQKITSAFLSIIFLLINLKIIFFHDFNFSTNINKISEFSYKETEVEQIGMKLLSIGQEGYILPFELISIFLLIILIGSIKISNISNK